MLMRFNLDGRLEAMRIFERLRFLLMALIALLGLSAVAMPQLIRGIDEAMEKTTKHEIAWTGQNGRSELHDLLKAVTILDQEPSPAAVDEVALRLDIMVSRLETWSAGRFGEFIAGAPQRVADFARIKAWVAVAEDLVSRVEQADARRELLRSITAIDEPVTRIAGAAYTRHSRENAENSAALKHYQGIQMALTVGLLVGGLALVGLLTLQNRLLKRSHRAQSVIAERNAFLASHDVLTELPNRKMFMAELDRACAAAAPDRLLAVIAIDLDGFKPVNDVLGHQAGDLLLMTIAKRLAMLADTATGGLAARFGGDEFLVMVQGLKEPEAAEAFAERIREELRLPNMIDGHRVSIDATLGLAIGSGPGSQSEALINQADIALNVGKSFGKGVVRVFHPEMLADAASKRELEKDLIEAQLDEFVPFYQPVIDLATRKVVGVEALARWLHPRRGLVSPADFIPLAESSGRIVEIGDTIMRKACADAMRWPEPIAVAVNLSAVQLMRADVPALAWQALADAGLPASRLKLEFTESVMIHDARGTRRLMTELQDMGITVSLDDFGTGFSSLSYLRTFPFDELKIDRSFVADILADPQAAAVVQTILALARSLDMTVVVEGIETEEQARLLTAMGCAKGQGWHFGKPVPAAELQQLLSSQSRAVHSPRSVAA
jgi:diguanylate cyclase (GGDEF)-like protein